MTESDQDQPAFLRPTEVRPGVIYLVGAGPGDPGLLTLRGAEILRQVGAVVYDRLANPALLKLARPDARLIFAGKAKDNHALVQEKINRVLVELAREGLAVCRLKGGDPFVFGRGGEEAAHLKAHGIPFEIVPGVSSAVAAPAYAGIPLTDRGVAGSFTVVAGHRDPASGQLAIDWANLARGADTLVVMMGLGSLETIARELIAHGRPAETPVAVIQEGTTERQRVVSAPLSEIARCVAKEQIEAPALIVIGQVVRRREELAWFTPPPDRGM